MREKLEAALQSAEVGYSKDVPLKQYTSFQVGGPAAFFCAPATAGALKSAVLAARAAGAPYCVLGRGSNLLFRDEGYPGLVIRPEGGEFSALETEGEMVRAGAAVPLTLLCQKALGARLSGLEFAYGIPGGVGGAVFMNAGAYGGEMADLLESVRFLDENLEEQTLPAGQLALGYRSSVFQQRPWVILSACLRLHTGEAQAIQAKMEENMRSREEKQPLHLPSAGSAFKRPPGAFAGALIDQCGLRGFRVGDAAISEKHCGFIVNLGHASCREILELAEEVTRRVEAQTGHRLEREFQLMDAPQEA